MIIAALPARWLNRFIADANTCYQLNVLVSTLGILVGICLLDLEKIPSSCLVRLLWSKECPFCNVTRSVALFLSGNIAGSWAKHHAGCLIAGLMCTQVPLRMAALANVSWVHRWTTLRAERRINWAVVAVCLGCWMI